MSVETFERSLWSALAAPPPDTPPLAGDADTEVLVVGAGFLGLSLALHLAESGVRATVLEAKEVGYGASGRNTGFVVPSLKTALGPDDVRRRLGEGGERLTALVGASGSLVFDLIRRHAIACSAEQTGWLQPAHTPEMARTLEARQAEWRARGRDVAILSADETARRVGTKGYQAALFDPTGGQINPLAYARGLARAAMGLGVAVHGGSPVERLVADGGRWRATTADGTVTADRIVLTTNAMIGTLHREVARSLVPVLVHQIATEPLPAALARTIIPERSPVADTRRHTFAVRWSSDGRLLTGGLVPPGLAQLPRAARFFTRRLARFFPELGRVRADFVWSGVIASTIDDLPRFMTIAPGLDALIGCNGRGIALTTALGRATASLYADRITSAEFPVPMSGPRPIARRELARRGPALWLQWSTFRDWLDTRRA